MYSPPSNFPATWLHQLKLRIVLHQSKIQDSLQITLALRKIGGIDCGLSSSSSLSYSSYVTLLFSESVISTFLLIWTKSPLAPLSHKFTVFAQSFIIPITWIFPTLSNYAMAQQDTPYYLTNIHISVSRILLPA